VVDDPTPNAFALPGGYIFLTRGMLALMNSEAELASVLGHEIGHVTAKHQVTMMSRAQLAQIGLGLGTVLVPRLQNLGGLASGGLQLLFLSYSRDAERQADDLGFRYAVGQRYDAREMARVFQSLQAGERDGARPLGTQPAPELPRVAPRRAGAHRVGAGSARPPVPAGTATRVEAASYLNRLNGMVYGENPRQGYFQQGIFLHPDLRFSIVFPSGWTTQNLPQAVTGGSPRQDALIQLTLAEQVRTADDAARRFFQQQGVQAGQGGRTTVNGFPAVVVYFQAQTQQGIIAGIAQWLEKDGQVYQVLAYAPGQVFQQYEGTFRQTLNSFASVTDPAVLNIRPNRIRVVRRAAGDDAGPVQHPLPVQHPHRGAGDREPGGGRGHLAAVRGAGEAGGAGVGPHPQRRSATHPPPPKLPGGGGLAGIRRRMPVVPGSVTDPARNLRRQVSRRCRSGFDRRPVATRRRPNDVAGQAPQPDPPPCLP
jgi:predicted Zn-dependent protease